MENTEFQNASQASFSTVGRLHSRSGVVEIWIVGNLIFDSFRQAEAAASAKSMHQSEPVPILTFAAPLSDFRIVKSIAGPSNSTRSSEPPPIVAEIAMGG